MKVTYQLLAIFSVMMIIMRPGRSYYVGQCVYHNEVEMSKMNVECTDFDLNIRYPDELPIDSNFTYEKIAIKNKNFKYLLEPILVNFSVSSLDLSSNRIEFISNLTFSEIIDIDSINLMDNKLTSVYIYDLFVQSYVKIELFANELASIEAKFSPNWEMIYSLSLDSNKITHIDDYSFAELANVGSLTLSSNKIDQISAKTFYGLWMLSDLYLNNNRLTRVDADTFSNLTQLMTLSLAFNYLKFIDPSAFPPESTTRLNYLYLSGNQFANCTHLGVDYQVKLNGLYLGTNYLSDMNECSHVFDKFTRLKSLFFKFNLIGSFDGEFFRQLKSLQTLYLNYLSLERFEFGIHLRNLTLLMNLNLDYNKLKELKMGCENGQLNLRIFSTLSISFNMISSIEKGFFRSFKTIKQLQLSHNLLDDISADVFADLNTLSNLHLDHNLIFRLAENTFVNLRSLYYLDLSYNRIGKIEKNAFNGLVSLQILQLSANKLEVVKAYYFEHLTALQYLYLVGDFILFIEPCSFKPLTQLTTLDLGNNYLTDLNGQLFEASDSINLADNQISEFDFIPRTDHLDLKRNKLTDWGVSLSLDAITVDLSENELQTLTIVHQTTVDRLILAKNRLRSFRVECDLVSINFLDLSHNQIESLKTDDFSRINGLGKLDLSYNDIKYIQMGFFKSLNHLYSLNVRHTVDDFDCDSLSEQISELDLSENRHLRFGGLLLDMRSLILSDVGLNRNELDNISSRFNARLYSLDLSFNPNLASQFDLNSLAVCPAMERLSLKSINLHSLDGDLLGHFHYLITLDLSFNRLSSIRADHFRNLTLLESLNLSDNQIEYVDEDSFKTLSVLNYLNMAKNRLRYFHLNYLTSLCVLRLSSNRLEKLLTGVDSWNGMGWMDLSGNQLTQVDFGCLFMSNINLTSLTLNGNLIGQITQGSFSNLYLLKTLDLSFNRMELIMRETFYNLRSLLYLNLSHNLLDGELDERLFDFQSQLVQLNLNHNRMEYLKPQLLASLFNLQWLDLSSNGLKFIQADQFTSLGQLIYLDVSNNTGLRLESLSALSSIKDIEMTFEQVEQNELVLSQSFRFKQVRSVGDTLYYQSIFVNYRDDPAVRVDCYLTLRLIEHNIQLNLKTDYQLGLFFNNCFRLDLTG